MKFNLFTKPLFRNIAVVSIILPAFSLVNTMAYATAPVVNVTTTAEPSSMAKNNLMSKLTKFAFFSAKFNQQIISETGELLQNGSGTLAISKPNLVNWKTITPDETLIVSDGKTLWFYDPFIEQASAYNLAKAVNNTPILLLTSDDAQLWQQYSVSHDNESGKGSRFVITPNDESSQIKQLTLSFNETTSNGVRATELTEFSFQDATGQISKIKLTDFNSKHKPVDALFTFDLPEGVRLEDKR